MMPSRRAFLAALVTGFAGCSAGPDSREAPTDGSPNGNRTPDTAAESPTGSPDAAPTPSLVTFPDGPKAEPTRPDPLTRASVREYVRTYECRYAYNELYEGPRWTVDLTVDVQAVEETTDGYRVRVRSAGSAERGVGTTTPTDTPVHADWGSREFVYVVTPDETQRGPAGYG